jgi:hypothetical protein
MLTLLVSMSACTSARKDARPPSGTVAHVVVCWLKQPGDEAARQAMIDRSREFATLPGVVRVTAGRAIPSDRPTVDSSYDVAVLITFRDRAALQAYDVHPIHRKAVAEVLKPLAAKVVLYDLEDSGR